MVTNDKNITLCRYWVKPNKEPIFRKLLADHWPIFVRLGLVKDNPPHLIFRGDDETRGIFYVEIFPWKDSASASQAHNLPEVGEIWGRMSECCTAMEFPSVASIDDINKHAT